MKRDGRYQVGTLATAIIIFEVLAAALWIAAYFLLSHADDLQRVPGAGIGVAEASRFRIARPHVLWAMLGGVAFTIIHLFDLAWKNRALARFGDSVSLPRMVPGVSGARSLFRFLFLRHGLSFVVVAMAGPQFGTRMEEVKAKGVDVMVALDVSNSMLCEDLKPSRMETSRRALSQLIDQLHGDRLGIVVFAGDAYVQLPITSDMSAARLFLNSIGPGMVPTQGTAIGAAIDLAAEGFGANGAASKTIIVISDGENHQDDAESAAKRAHDADIVVNTIGMGKPEGGPLPLKQGALITGYKKDKNGQTVVSKLDEVMLQRIAAAGNGQFVRATEQDSGIGALVGSLRQMDQTEVGTYQYVEHEDQYRIFLATGCALIFAALALAERGSPSPKWMTLRS